MFTTRAWQLLLGWAEYLGSEDCTNLLTALYGDLQPPKSRSAHMPKLEVACRAAFVGRQMKLPRRNTVTGMSAATAAGILKPGGGASNGSFRYQQQAQSALRAGGAQWSAAAPPVPNEASRQDSAPKLIPVTKDDTWLSLFIKATAKLPFAISVANAHSAGMQLVYVNAAFEALTGYSRAEACGHNCRFLQQGHATEEAGVSELARSIRERRPCVVTITNYTKDKRAFMNELSMHPVYDSRGVYRYMIAIASDAGKASPSAKAMLVSLRHLMPTQFPASLNEREERVVVDKAAQEGQFLWSMVPSVSRQLLAEGEKGISRALSTRQSLVAFWHFLEDQERELLGESGMDVAALQKLISDGSFSVDLGTLISPDVAKSINALERRPFEMFLQTQAGEVLTEKLAASKRLPTYEESNFFLPSYIPPTDAAGWLRAFALLAAPMRSQICLSDMSLPGNPLIYVNEAWCQCTGYSREEVLGNNCRLLQGPNTEAEAVQTMINGMRDGDDVCVRVTNCSCTRASPEPSTYARVCICPLVS